jgi:predicted anti-sigma-YlaC factor YlaD
MSNAAIHDRAVKLIAQARVEGMPEIDSTWLRTHLEECDSCSEHARQTDRALRLMRTAAIPMPEGLASRTQFRVRLRAQELRDREPKRRALWLACAVSWAFGIASAPYVWRLFQWFGERTGVPRLVWELGFGLWWTVPALFLVVVILTEKVGRGSESDWTRQTR